jgi:hypothetical protein
MQLQMDGVTCLKCKEGRYLRDREDIFSEKLKCNKCSHKVKALLYDGNDVDGVQLVKDDLKFDLSALSKKHSFDQLVDKVREMSELYDKSYILLKINFDEAYGLRFETDVEKSKRLYEEKLLKEKKLKESGEATVKMLRRYEELLVKYPEVLNEK